MFKHSHLETKLREHARAGRAEILSIKTEGKADAKAEMDRRDALRQATKR
jgi:hypothetical protein